jgi:hypothetical protein
MAQALVVRQRTATRKNYARSSGCDGRRPPVVHAAELCLPWDGRLLRRMPCAGDICRKIFKGIRSGRWIDGEVRVQLCEFIPQHSTLNGSPLAKQVIEPACWAMA